MQFEFPEEDIMALFEYGEPGDGEKWIMLFDGIPMNWGKKLGQC